MWSSKYLAVLFGIKETPFGLVKLRNIKTKWKLSWLQISVVALSDDGSNWGWYGESYFAVQLSHNVLAKVSPNRTDKNLYYI